MIWSIIPEISLYTADDRAISPEQLRELSCGGRPLLPSQQRHFDLHVCFNITRKKKKKKVKILTRQRRNSALELDPIRGSLLLVVPQQYSI